jgi:5-methyltetrahydropteroyltriglutamate--homocysteine methyltransferase
MKAAIVGYPRLGTLRELKFATEKYFKGVSSKAELQETAVQLRKAHWQTQREKGVDFIPSNDFSFYDNMLDTAVLLNAVPNGIGSWG